ncbi:MAG: ABC transporter ATP-binding protein, partial [Dehalococcoidia bacterium]
GAPGGALAPRGAGVIGLRLTGIEARPGGARVLAGVDLEVPAGGRLALVGPSGAGKTTLLRVIAGLEPASAGRVEAAGRPLDGLPPHRRPIAMVFQDARLLPSMDAAENVAFALRAAGVGRRERRARADALLAEVGLDGFGRRGVRGMSGGEQQRVALARALCPDPGLLLLDEPMASVDPDRRAALRRLILRLQAERRVTTVIVTHDRDEAAEMGQEIALMIEGRIVQRDTPRALFLRPSSPAVARFFGARNLLAGDVRAGALHTEAGPLPVPGPDGPARVSVRAESIALGPDGPLRMTVREATFVGSGLRVRLARGDMRLEARVAPDPAPEVGEEIGVSVPAEAVWRFPEGAARTSDADRALQPER